MLTKQDIFDLVEEEDIRFIRLQFTDMLKEISATNIQYIMTKPIMDRYLESLHAGIVNNFSNISAVKLDHRTIFTYYYQQISCLDDMFESHKAL